ncbi:MAG TPA: Lrp/AsnC family transcriptional regulator [Thermomicrobiales bacterium]|nr:Lrp/AsnC family transcriptional regulator [Thermomicrobiales bacterium]
MSEAGTAGGRKPIPSDRARQRGPASGARRGPTPAEQDSGDLDTIPRLDALETAIVRTLERESRMSVLELSRQLGASRTTISERLARLIEEGVIRGFHARVDYRWLGYPVTAFVGLEIAQPERGAAIVDALAALPEVEEIHAITGDLDLLLKVRARSPEHLQRAILPAIQAIPGVRRRETTLALATYLEGAAVGVARPARGADGTHASADPAGDGAG